MLIAGEASGDTLAAELVQALRLEFGLALAAAAPSRDSQPLRAGLEPRFFGAGGPRMAAAGVELAFDMTAHSVLGLSDVLRDLLKFRRLFDRLFGLALDRQPDAIICVDFSGFNRRFAHAVRNYTRSRCDWFHDWNPRLIQYVSPQVWASREGRARKMARDCDLLLSILPFERAWFAQRLPAFRVEFVGHPMVDRCAGPVGQTSGLPVRGASGPVGAELPGAPSAKIDTPPEEALTGRPEVCPTVLLLPGSRPGELRRHLPVLLEAARLIAAELPASFRMILPDETLARSVQSLLTRAQGQAPPLPIQVQTGGLAEALARADLALTKSGTITLECAFFGVPAIVFYKTSLITYLAAKQIVKVKYIAMPNLLAGQPLFPEFIQGAATPRNIARAAVALLRDEPRRAAIKARVAQVVSALGPAGASRRAARAIVRLLEGEGPVPPR